MKIAVLHGPNLNRLGKRNPGKYGHATLADITADIDKAAAALGVDVVDLQSNSEATLVDFVHDAQDQWQGIVINPASLSSVGYPLLDSLRDTELPFAVIHISQWHAIDAKERVDIFASTATVYVAGAGWRGYSAALDAIVHKTATTDPGAVHRRGKDAARAAALHRDHHNDAGVPTMSNVIEHQKHPRKAAIAAWVGSSLEYYDFFVYGTVAALVFPKIFFDQSNPTTATLASLATFGVAYIARPVGSFLMGHIGDKVGRKTVMVGTLLLMGLSTFLIGCLPTYSSIGIWAPILLVLLRVLQGLSASGKQAGANSMSFEHAPDRRRGYYTSWTLSGTVGGQVIAPAVVLPLSALLTDQQLQTWGWRIPFLLSAIVVLVGYLIRRTLDETPAFEAEAEEGTIPTVPLKILFRDHWRGVVRVFFAAFIAATGTLFSVFGLAFATGSVYGIGISRTSMLWLAIVSNFIAIFTIPMFAGLSDRIGRKRVFISGIIGCALSLSLFFWSVTTGNIVLIFATGILFNSFLYAMTNAVWPATYAEIFPTKVRLSGMAVGTQFGFALAGFSPTIAAVIAGDSANGWVPVAVFVCVICLVSGISVALGRETHETPMDDLGKKPADKVGSLA